MTPSCGAAPTLQHIYSSHMHFFFNLVHFLMVNYLALHLLCPGKCSAGNSSSVHHGCTAIEQSFVTPWIGRVNISHFSVWFSLRSLPHLTSPVTPAGYFLLPCVSHMDLLGEFLAVVGRGQTHLQSWSLQSGWFAPQQCTWERSLGWCPVTKGHQWWSKPVPVCAASARVATSLFSVLK